MKEPVDIADALERAADKLPDLVFDQAGKLVSGTPSPRPKKPKAKKKRPAR